MNTSFFALEFPYFASNFLAMLVVLIVLLNAKKLFLGFARILGQSVKEFRNAAK
jgi:Sec-independent protein translocase protein TatA